MSRDRDRNKSPASEDRERDVSPAKRDNKSNTKLQYSDPSSESDHKSRKRSRERKRTKHRENSDSESDYSSESEGERKRRKRREKKRREERGKKRTKHVDDSGSESESEWESEYSSESEGERRRRKRRERKRREEREREKKKRRREKEKKKKKKKEKDKKREKGKKGAVTSSWGKYGIIRETDMWNKRPEFTAWLAEVKQLNLESLPNWEEKQLFKDFMEDHNTATFPSKKYYNLDAYYKRKLEKETIKGMKSIGQTEMTVFNDEEIRRQEMQQVRDRQKAEEVEALKRSMQGGMAQAMKEQALLREEMLYQYKIGNLEAAAAIQRRLDPDVAM